MHSGGALVIGEALVDVVRSADGRIEQHAGGSAANVAVALARLGRPTRFATSFADDSHGRLIADHLDRSGVTLVGDPHVVRRTTTATATLGPDGAASYAFDVDWRLDPVPAEEAPEVVHVCSYGAVLQPGATSVTDAVAALAGRSVISYDLNLRPAVTGTGEDVLERVLGLVRHADLVKASDEDLEALFPAATIDDSARDLLGRGPAAVVVTRGGRGARCHLPGGALDVAAPSVSVVDTIGAGDTFSAAMIDALWGRGLLTPAGVHAAGVGDWEQVLGHAARAAAVTVSRAGADPPYRRELEP